MKTAAFFCISKTLLLSTFHIWGKEKKFEFLTATGSFFLFLSSPTEPWFWWSLRMTP